MNFVAQNRRRFSSRIRLVAVVLAGLGAFVVGVQFSSPSSGPIDAEPVVVAPILRAQSAAANPASAPVPAPAPASLRSERLSDHITHNPFGALVVSVAPPMSAAGPSGKAISKTNAKAALEVPAPPPPAPTAPPLPFTAIGSIAGAQVTGGQQLAFIKQQDQLLVVRTGDAIGRSYRVESVTAQRIEFMYLPLMQRQSLALAP